MASISGSSGSVTFATGYTTTVKSWSVDYSGEALETTNFSSSGKKEYIAGLTGWSGSYSCLLDGTTVSIAPGAAPAEATFTASAGRTLVGSIIVTGVSYKVDVAGVNAVDVTFQGTATLAIN